MTNDTFSVTSRHSIRRIAVRVTDLVRDGASDSAYAAAYQCPSCGFAAGDSRNASPGTGP